MFTKIELQGEYTIVHVSGRLDIDKSAAFKQACMSHLKGKKVIFSLEKLNFVGSTGITNFFQTIKDVNNINEVKCRVVGLTSDFKRVLGLFNVGDLITLETIENAITSIERPHELQLADDVLKNTATQLEISKLSIIESTSDDQKSTEVDFTEEASVVDLEAVRNS